MLRKYTVCYGHQGGNSSEVKEFNFHADGNEEAIMKVKPFVRNIVGDCPALSDFFIQLKREDGSVVKSW